MVGRADKGLFITTGADSRVMPNGRRCEMAAPAIDLIDGMDLCDLLKDLQLGITTETVEVPTVNPGFFAGV